MNHQRLNRTTYGPTEASVKALDATNWEQWVQQQLHPTDEDPEVDQRAKRWEMTMKFKGSEKKIAFRDYFKTAEELWTVAQQKPIPDFEANRPFMETLAYSWMKQVYSQWQLNELMVEFWHNHFNVSCETDRIIALLFPVYDREVIRKHALGNFRQFLEAVAQSPCMLYYLDNVHSKASPANENYARELMELHTMGEAAYVNHLYQHWKEVPGALEGKAEGFIDEDIYEVARAFTGWTVGNRRREHQDPAIPSNGKFYYNERWHDNYQKRILGREFGSHRGTMQDGLDVLDMVATHPATAKFICTKLCRWLVADTPPQSVIDKAVKAWQANEQAEDQIANVVHAILLSSEFEQHLGQKIKRPNILMTSFIRATNMTFTPFADFHWLLGDMGYHQYTWGPPTGHPDRSDYWVNSNMLLKRWNALGNAIYVDEAQPQITLDLLEQTPAINTAEEAIQYWAKRLLGAPLETAKVTPLTTALMADVEYDTTLGEVRSNHPEWYHHKLRKLIGLLACTPEFQQR